MTAIFLLYKLIHYPANMKHSPIVGSMLDQRRRRWTNIEPTMGSHSCGYYTAMLQYKTLILIISINEVQLYTRKHVWTVSASLIHF